MSTVSLTPQDLKNRLLKHDFEGYQQLIKAYGTQLYSACHYFCLGVSRLEEDFFKRVLKRATHDTDDLGEDVQAWLFGHLHKEWLTFFKSKSVLGSQYSPLTFEWSRPIGRQTEDALAVLAPLPRALFYYRFVCNLPLSVIRQITNLTEARLVEEFEAAVAKVST